MLEFNYYKLIQNAREACIKALAIITSNVYINGIFIYCKLNRNDCPKKSFKIKELKFRIKKLAKKTVYANKKSYDI
jgi:hypothetical protein